MFKGVFICLSFEKKNGEKRLRKTGIHYVHESSETPVNQPDAQKNKEKKSGFHFGETSTFPKQFAVTGLTEHWHAWTQSIAATLRLDCNRLKHLGLNEKTVMFFPTVILSCVKATIAGPPNHNRHTVMCATDTRYDDTVPLRRKLNTRCS